MKEKKVKTVVGLFDTHAHAEAAALELERAGISHEDISLIANNSSGQFSTPSAETTGETNLGDAESETGKGAVAGGVAGLLLGLAALTIPGLGIIAAAGWLTTMVTGALVGAGVGLVGALNGVGVSHEEASLYTEGVRRGGTLLAARVPDDQVEDIAQLLSSNGAVNIAERAEQYRQEGFVVPAAPQIDTPQTSTTPAPARRKTNADALSPAVPVDTTANVAPLAAPEAAPVSTPKAAASPLPAQPVATAYEPAPADGPAGNGNEDWSTRDLHPLIEIRAYELYERRGRGDGHALDDWLAAEKQVWNNPAERAKAPYAAV